MNPQDVLNQNSHRPWALPAHSWTFYQEWNHVLFMHWEVPIELLRTCVPEGMNIDTFEGKAYVSLVAFQMQKVRPRNLPSMSFISDFEELNLRTYIDNDGKKGVYFISIEAGKRLSAYVSRKLSGLPYRKSNMLNQRGHYVSRNDEKDVALDVTFEVGEKLAHKTTLDHWLTERYCCIYADRNNNLYRYEMHHPEWELKSAEISKINVSYPIETMNLSARTPELVHYSEGVKVLAWKKYLIR